jgi:hypothetical protein
MRPFPPRWLPLTLFALLAGCSCAQSHRRDAGPGMDAFIPTDAGPPDAGPPDAPRMRGPTRVLRTAALRTRTTGPSTGASRPPPEASRPTARGTTNAGSLATTTARTAGTECAATGTSTSRPAPACVARSLVAARAEPAARLPQPRSSATSPRTPAGRSDEMMRASARRFSLAALALSAARPEDAGLSPGVSSALLRFLSHLPLKRVEPIEDDR